jgi:hypothetical protein
VSPYCEIVIITREEEEGMVLRERRKGWFLPVVSPCQIVIITKPHTGTRRTPFLRLPFDSVLGVSVSVSDSSVASSAAAASGSSSSSRRRRRRRRRNQVGQQLVFGEEEEAWVVLRGAAHGAAATLFEALHDALPAERVSTS